MKFYKFSQNNSGGQWDKSLPHFLLIEAENTASADYKAEAMGVYFDGCDSGQDCNCCGDRWHRAEYATEYTREELPKFRESAVKYSDWHGLQKYRIHFADGTIEGSE